MTTIKDVAQKAGVSIATVSHVLNGTKPVSGELRKNVLSAVEELHYQVNPFAHGIKTHTTHTIGIILTSIDNLFFPQVIKGIDMATENTDYSFQFYNTNLSFATEQEHLRTVCRNRVDGIILNTVASPTNTAYLKELTDLKVGKKGIHVVCIEQDLTAYGLDSVGVNNYAGGCMASRHLIETGCRRIVHISGPASLAWARNRLGGYADTLAQAQLPLLVKTGDFSALSGYQCVYELLQSGEPFDGVFAANDLMAIGALKALREFHIHVPGQVRVVGYDNTFASSLIHPSLSTIHVPQAGIGKTAAQLLISRIECAEHVPPVFMELPLRLMERQSTREGKPENWELFFG